jgi:lipopolysaccharide/colanic/teichoic acid biosynthesis glycosyltransferase
VKRKVMHDLEYIARRSAWEDFKIMLKTIPVMLFRKGGW